MAQTLISQGTGTSTSNATSRPTEWYDGLYPTSTGSVFSGAGASFNFRKDWGIGNTKRVTGIKARGITTYGFVNDSDPTVTVSLYGSTDASSWVSLGSGTVTDASQVLFSKLTGFDTTTVYRYHEARVSFTPANLTVAALVVAGGGGGGANVGGGGGGGGYQYNASFSVSSGSYAVTVGDGGAGGDISHDGRPGGNSSFSSITATGGGGGAMELTLNGGNGGSGGGGGYLSSGIGGTGTVGQGHDGGNGGGTNGTTAGAGGGGGATSAGSAGAINTGGNGGAGTANSISGSSVTYAGGGGGGANLTAGSGGSGGGGNGNNFTGVGAAGGVNTGGGGGGGGNGDNTGSLGGSGIVIISYPTPANDNGSGGTITHSGGNTIHTFTSSGTFTTPASVMYCDEVEFYEGTDPFLYSGALTIVFGLASIVNNIIFYSGSLDVAFTLSSTVRRSSSWIGATGIAVTPASTIVIRKYTTGGGGTKLRDPVVTGGCPQCGTYRYDS